VFVHVSSRTADQLSLESGCMFEHPAAAHFRRHILDGEWDKVFFFVYFILAALKSA